MSVNISNLSLTSYEDIFKNDELRDEDKREKIMEVPLSELYSFENHPFRVCDDDAMSDMVESIEKYGVLVPCIARPREAGGYELVAGHRRKRACEIIGNETIPVIIRELDNDEAIIIMIDSNLQREALLFSEKAFAYKMKLDAIKRQSGRQPKENGSQVGINSFNKKSYDIIAEQSGESKNQVYRYIRLTELITELLNMVDGKKIAFSPAVELSYLKKEEQSILLDAIEKELATPSLSQAKRMKGLSQEDKLTPEAIDAIMSEEKKEVEKVTFTGKRLKKYFPRSVTPKEIEETIINLLENWYEHQQQPVQ